MWGGWFERSYPEKKELEMKWGDLKILVINCDDYRII
jgi:hypothetical protein